MPSLTKELLINRIPFYAESRVPVTARLREIFNNLFKYDYPIPSLEFVDKEITHCIKKWEAGARRRSYYCGKAKIIYYRDLDLNAV